MVKDMKKTLERVNKGKTVQQLETAENFDDYSDPVSSILFEYGLGILRYNAQDVTGQ